MRKLSIAMICVAGVFAIQPSSAGGRLHGEAFSLAKPGMTAEQFELDRKECVAFAIATYRAHFKKQSSRAGRRHLCQQVFSPGPPPYNGLGQVPLNYMENTNRVPSQPSGYNGADYDLGDRYFYRCMHAKGYERTYWKTGLHAGPLWQ